MDSPLTLRSSRHTWATLWWLLLAAVPVLYIALHVVSASRNIVFWDEFDTALDLILHINAGADWHEIVHRFFAINNEHRTVTSRLLYALSYWITGTINFHVIGAIGNLFIVGTCAILIASIAGWARRLRLAVLLAFLIFQLEHFENFLWSGASIDHFQVVMLGVGAIAGLVRRTWVGTILALLLGILAVFTLAHGSVVWPVGACLLAQQRRWRELSAWIVCGAATLAAFLYGFEFNPAHKIVTLNWVSAGHLVRYWLALIGAPLTLADAGFAPIPGIVFLIGLGVAASRGAMQREPLAFFSALFCVAALALVAYGRANLAGAEINSRYLVLGALSWALLLFVLLEFAATPEHPFRWLGYSLPALIAFNVAANLHFAPFTDAIVEVRDRAASSFIQFEEDGRGIMRLHPRDRHAEVLLKMAAERGVYHLPQMSEEASFPEAQPSNRIITYLDELIVNEHAVTAGGWAMIPGKLSKRGQVYVVLRTGNSTLIFSTVTLQRPDVAKAYHEPKWRLSGFRAVIERVRLPAEDFQVGVLIADGAHAEYLMTNNRIQLAPGKEAKAVRATDAQ